MTFRKFGTLTVLSGGLVIFASFLPWLDIYGRNRSTPYHVTFDGVQVHALTGFGDGYLVLVFGTVAVIAGVLAAVVPSRQHLLALVISATGIFIAGIALNDLLQIRPGSKYWPEFILGGEIYDLNAGIALWLILVLGVTLVVASAVLLLRRRSPEAPSIDGPSSIFRLPSSKHP